MDSLKERIARLDRCASMHAIGYKDAKPEDGGLEGLDFQFADLVLADPDIKQGLELLELKKQGKLVKLADDQIMPQYNGDHDGNHAYGHPCNKCGYEDALRQLYRDNWRKIETL